MVLWQVSHLPYGIDSYCFSSRALLLGSEEAIDSFVQLMSLHPFFAKIDWKFSHGKGDHLPFLTLSIRRVKELISPGSSAAKTIDTQAHFDESTFGGLSGTGTHLSPEEFHQGNH